MEPKWIEITDDEETWPHPEDGYEIIFITDGKEVLLADWRVEGNEATVSAFVKIRGTKYDNITHWMPFPYKFPELPTAESRANVR